MSRLLYDKDGSVLNAAYNKDAASLPYVYDKNQNVYDFIDVDDYTTELIEKAERIANWLENRSIDNTANGKRVKERYRMDLSQWVTMHRVFCNMQVVTFFFTLWKFSNNSRYLTLGRDIFDSIILLQNQDGSIPSADTDDTDIYTSGNSDEAALMAEMAEIDTERASTYLTHALAVTDFIITQQTQSGGFKYTTSDSRTTLMATAQAVYALSVLADSSPNASSYETAVASGITYISGLINSSGRITTVGETFRPPASEQSLCIRAIASAEKAFPNNANASSWKTLRTKMLSWLDLLIAPIGAVRMGLGEGLGYNDIYDYTDHVYVTAFAVQAYYFSYEVDNIERYKINALRIILFTLGNVYTSNDVDTNGTIRGAWNIEEESFNCPDYYYKSLKEGGPDMIYTGWDNAPMAEWFYKVAYNDF